MAKQLNVNLAFTADTGQAKAQIQDLQNSLNNIAKMPMSSNSIDKTTEDIKAASTAALNLSVHLKNALNQDTGRLDFAKLNQSLKKSGTSLDNYANSIRNIGPEGEKAFLQLARAISTSEVPIRRSNQLMQEMWTTMKNTARWQISSSALHAFMGTMQSAYGYAQNLNESLNNIRIVTGYNTDQMAKFAVEANKAAKALSTTTTEYTNASLIYYQQGLNDQQVKERTDITVKMANVSRESAQTVSDQMTAVWNNFYDGSKSLEYYADVMTALGAATASSTAEISAGLEKFAAIAETVGLSYEYSTAALATITATTRQSADVVGNALKTLFARIQGLFLGETLEDGVDLNKYSKALDTVGVKVLESNGQMREMDDILNDLAAKWDTIGKAEQTALAQTVAGVRQYTQLVALMDNWEFMEENLETAYSSTGTLEEQAEIYADSWEAASNRVRAAAENIYDSLINDEFFITLLNGFEGILTVVGNLIDSLGGMGGALSAVGVIFTKMFSTQMQQGLENMAYNIKMSTEYGRQKERDELWSFFEKDRIAGRDTSGSTPIAEAFDKEKGIYQRFLLEQDSMSEVDKEIVKKNIDLLQAADDDVVKNYENQSQAISKRVDAFTKVKGIFGNDEGIDQTQLTTKLNNLQKATESYYIEKEKLDQSFKAGAINAEEYDGELRSLQDTLLSVENQLLGKDSTKEQRKAVEDFIDASEEAAEAKAKLDQSKYSAKEQAKATEGAMDNAKNSVESWSSVVVNAANSTLQLTMGLNALNSMWDTISNPDVSGWEKFQAVLTSLTIAIPAIMSGLSGIAAAYKKITQAVQSGTIATALNTATQILNNKAKEEGGKILIKNAAKEKIINELIQSESSGILEKGIKIGDTLFQTKKKKGKQNSLVLKKRESPGGNFSEASEEEEAQVATFISDKIKTAFQKAVENLEQGKEDEEDSLVKTIMGKIQDLGEEDQGEDIGSTLEEFKKLATTIFDLIKNYKGLIIGITAAAVAITVASAAWHAHETAVKKAQEAVDRTTESYNKLSQKAETFKDTVSNWESAKESLSELKKGTDEYADALDKANEKARQLIEAYGLFGQADYVNGVIQINPEALKNVESQYDKEVALAGYQMYDKKVALSQAEINRDSVNFARKNLWMSTVTENNGIQTFKSLDKNQIAEIAKIVADYDSGTGKDMETYLKESLNSEYQDFISIILTKKDDLKSFGDSLNQATEESDYYTQQMKMSAMEYAYGDIFDKLATDELGEVNEELRASIAAAAASLTDFTGAVSSTASTLTGINWLDWFLGGIGGVWQDGENWDDRYLEYAKLQGYTDEELKGAYVKGTSVYNAKGEALINDVDRGLVYSATTDARNAEENLMKSLGLGQVVEDEYDYIPLGDGQYARVPKAKESNKQEVAFEEKVSSILNAGNINGDDFSQLTLNALSNEGKFDFSSMYGSLSESDFATLKNLSGDEIAQKLGLSADDVARNWKDSAGLEEAFKSGLGDFDAERFRSSANANGNIMAESFGLDIEQFKAYRDILYETNDNLKEQPELLNKIAIAQLRLNKGAKSIKDSYDDLSPLIKKAQKEMSSKNGKVAAETWSEISSYMTDATTAMEDMLNLDKGALDNLNPEFLVENYDLLTQAANGSKEAFDKLQKVMGQELAESLGLTGESYQQLISDIVDASANMEVGDVADNALSSKLSSMYNQAYDAAIQGGKSVADAMAIANDMVNNVGFDMPDIEMETITAYVPKKLPDTITPNIDGIVDTGDLRAAGISWSRTPGPGFTEPITITVPKTSNVNFTKSSETVGGGGGSKGGGGGGGSKKPQKKNDSDKERYHTVKNQLEDLKDAYDDVSEAADRAFGAEKLALMEEEIAKTDDLIAKQEEYVDAIEANLEPDKQAFVGLYDKYIQGPKVEFDANGNISNFDEIQDAMYELYNKNAESMSEEEWAIFEEHYKQVEEYMKQYEETYDLLREEENELQDLVNQRIDLLLEKVKYEIELKLSIADDSLELLDFQLSRLDDKAFAVAETLALLGDKAEVAKNQLETNLKGMSDVLKQSGVSDAEIAGFLNGSISVDDLASKYNFTEAQIETLRQYKSGALEALEAMQALREEAQNKVSEAFDAWNEQLQEALDKFDHLNNVLQSYKNIIDIVGESMLGITDELMDNLNKAIVDNAINQLDSSRRAWEALQDAEKTAKDALAEAYKSGNEEDIKYWEGEVERINQEAAAAQETMLANWENTLTLIIEQFEKAVEDAVESFNKSFTADGTFLSDAYDKRQKENERYIEDYQKIYELSKLTRDINNSIDDSDNLASKAKLKELLGEINEYEAEGVEMSEYDVEYLQKKYDLYKAQIALEEAQAAKDTVRLTKDNEGNWSYAYTTDSSKIEQAEQDYEDALYALQELNYEYLEELESSIVDTMEEMGDALANIKREDFATYEEYQAEIDRVTAFYMDQIAYYQSEMQSGIDRNKELYEEDWQAYNRITGYKISANEDFITSWKETTLGGLTESESETVDIYQRVVDSLDVLIAGLLEAYRVMSEDIDEANEAAGTSTENFGEHVGDVTTQVQDDSEAAGEAVDDMANQMEAGFEAATTALLKWQSQYSAAMEKAITDTLGVVDAFNLLIKTLAEGKPTVDASKNNSNNSSNNSTGGQSSNSNSNKNNTSNSGNNSKNQTSTTYFDRQEYDAEQAAKQKQENQRANSRNKAMTLDEKQKHGFATGGYTGNWGDTYGRLAWLHKKELVLNQQDTSNILLTVQLVRQLAQTIDLNAQSASAGIGLLTALSLRDEKQMDTLQQEVTIHAEFPNVQDQNEIRLALSDLVNTASQYANRK